MNKTLAIVAIIAAALVVGIFATSIQAAHAGGVSFAQINKQSSSCTALLIAPVNCNNVGINAFLVGGG